MFFLRRIPDGLFPSSVCGTSCGRLASSLATGERMNTRLSTLNVRSPSLDSLCSKKVELKSGDLDRQVVSCIHRNHIHPIPRFTLVLVNESMYR
jgi:hypothetical protein